MADRREHILTTSHRLFRHYGFAKTTIADIAREAKVAVGTVYLEFDSKELILEALSVRAHGRVLEAMTTAAVAKQLDDRLTRALEARTAAFLELHAEGQHARELVFCGTDGVNRANQRFCEEERALFARILEDGTRPQAEVDRLAVLVQKSVVALTPPMLEHLSKEDAKALTTDLAALLLEGLSRKSKKR